MCNSKTALGERLIEIAETGLRDSSVFFGRGNPVDRCVAARGALHAVLAEIAKDSGAANACDGCVEKTCDRCSAVA